MTYSIYEGGLCHSKNIETLDLAMEEAETAAFSTPVDDLPLELTVREEDKIVRKLTVGIPVFNWETV